MYNWISKAANSFMKYLQDEKPHKRTYLDCSEEPEEVIIIYTPENLIRAGRELMKERAQEGSQPHGV